MAENLDIQHRLPPPRRHHRARRRHRARCRGTASIEMVLCASVMVVVYFLVWGTMRVHHARQQVVEESHRKAFTSAQPGLLGRLPGGGFVGAFLDQGGTTTSHPAIVEPTLGQFKEPDGFPQIRSLPNLAYTGRDSERVGFSMGRPNHTFSGTARYRVAIPTGPPWTYWSDQKEVKPYHDKMLKFGIGDVADPLKLAKDPIAGEL